MAKTTNSKSKPQTARKTKPAPAKPKPQKSSAKVVKKKFAENPQRKAKSETSRSPKTTKKSRAPPPQEDDQAEQEGQEEPANENPLRLVPVVRKVQIADWVPLSDNAREEILKVMQSVSFAIYSSLTTEEHRRTAQEVIAGLLEKFERKLRRLPVPASTKDWSFQYEKTLEMNAQLETALASNVRQITTLEAEITAEEKAIEEDNVYLQSLKRNAKSQEMSRAVQQKKLDQLFRDSSEIESQGDDAESINFVLHDYQDPQTTNDKDIQNLLERLRPHLASMSANIAGLDEVLSATRQVAGALFSLRE
ncbi:CENP-Q, a CENPA-CAD centromere complex subunit-domain-containing protein [Myxozyma melibiosi]|uniref:CENP-Q, a CENPA-CAD centromere complex subunit-domain-containing protein n=1 Tax=Myxozyma melibiosi TaxID=54550 RepID=A0ABR1FE34_9ASCO